MTCRFQREFVGRNLMFAVALALGTLSVPVHALGLGDIKASSTLNQTFKADIELRSVAGEELADLRVKLAGPEEFAKAGIERPFFLTLLKFRPERLKDGRTVIRVTSDFPIREPFLDFFVEVDWPKGHLIREYTVLLDPPVTTKRRAPTVRPATAAARTAPSAPTSQAAAPPSPAPRGGTEYGPVSANETLWGIAKKFRPSGVTMQQMMVAVWRANPEAFIEGDMNRLRRGQVLRLPSVAEIQAISRAEAVQLYREARQQWLNRQVRRKSPVAQTQPMERPTEGPDAAESHPELRIVTARPEGRGEAGVGEGRGDVEPIEEIRRQLLLVRENAESSRLETTALQKEVEALRKRLADMQRLLTLKDEQLAQLQAGAGRLGEPHAEKEGTEVRPAAPEHEVEKAPSGESEGTKPTVAGGAEAVTPTEPGLEPELAAAANAVLDEGLDREQVSRPGTAMVPPSEPDAARPAGAGTPTPESPVQETAPAEVVVASEPAKASPVPDGSPARPPEEGFGVMRWVEEVLPLVASAGGILALVLVLLGVRRRLGRKPVQHQEAAPGTATAGGAGAAAATSEVGGGAPHAAEVDDISGITADSELFPDHEEDTSFLSEFSPDTPSGLRDETRDVDPVSEADVYIAYGRYQQAEDLLKQALGRDPDRLALKHKLLEVYYATRNPQAFNDLAQGMVEAGQHIADRDAWARIREMGRELDPHNDLYTEQDTASGEIQTEDVDAETTASDEMEAGEMDAETKASDEMPAGEMDAETTASDEMAAGAVEVQTTPRSDANVVSDLEDGRSLDGESFFDDVSLELDALSELDALDELDEESRPIEGTEALELPSLDLGQEEGAPTAKPAATDLQAQLDELSDLSSLEGDLSRLTDDIGKAAESGSEKRPPDLGDAAALEGALEEADVDSVNAESVEAGEIETKFDLAKAFIEMGDHEGARDILEEIREEGNEAQRQEAEQLLAEMA